jgi:hypothetical protein
MDLTEFTSKQTLAGELVINRKLKPCLTRERLMNAYLILYRMTSALSIIYWCPMLYCYQSKSQLQEMWRRMGSIAHYREKKLLFGVQAIGALKECVCKCVPERRMRYRSFMPVDPNILDSINLKKIATSN